MKLFNEAEMEKFIEAMKNRIGEGSPIGNILVSMKNRMGIGDPARNATDIYERGKKIVPDSIKPDEGEIPVKQYNIAILRNLFKFERSEGRMQITNKRMIFRAAGRSVGGRTTLQHEFAINEIAGIEAIRNYKFSLQYLIGAILIICLSVFFITRCSSIFSGNKPSPKTIRMAGQYMMLPSHVRRAHINEGAAINQRGEAEKNVDEATKNLKTAQEKETQAAAYISRYGENRRIDIGRYQYVWINTSEYHKEALEEKEEAEKEQQQVIAELETAKEKEAEAIKKREATENTWKVSMTVLGLILGIGGLLPFFVLYKKFGIKLFMLNFCIFGFTLSFTASGNPIFNLLRILSIFVAFVCIFIFCFRPNLVISIKNKMGSGKGPVDIRRNEYMNKIMGLVSLAIGIVPVTFFWGAIILNRVMNVFGSSPDGGSLIDIGGILSTVLPIILLAILLPLIVRSIQSKNNGWGPDSGFAEVIPTEETEGAIREIGAIIGDIQKLGDLGLEKWNKE
jgi:VIT1/CCC1 family predicted Fe2+/Mn2+ transporter